LVFLPGELNVAFEGQASNRAYETATPRPPGLQAAGFV
jgi:hypothetical protein